MRGARFIRWGAAFARAELEIDGRVITRKRGRKGNTYSLDGKKFAAFGNGVPPEIAKLLRLSPLNFQRQADQPFWFTDSPGQVGKSLNAVVSLDLIDSSLSNISHLHRKSVLSVEVSQERLQSARKARRDLAFVPPLNERLVSLELAEQKITTLEAEITSLQNMALEIRDVQKRVKVRIPDLAAFEARERAIAVEAGVVESLEGLISAIRRTEERVCQKKVAVRRCEERLTKLAGKRCPLCGSFIRKIPSSP